MYALMTIKAVYILGVFHATAAETRNFTPTLFIPAYVYGDYHRLHYSGPNSAYQSGDAADADCANSHRLLCVLMAVFQFFIHLNILAQHYLISRSLCISYSKAFQKALTNK